MTRGAGLWWAELGGLKNIVPDESGTNDRMNPVFRLTIPQLVSNFIES
jgi:hypothetical protein